MSNDVSVLKGTLLHDTRYRRDDFMIGYVRAGGVDFCVVGEIVDPAWGETYEFIGRWESHAKYGKQFRFVAYNLILPTQEDGIFNFLVRSMKWLNRRQADALIGVYGEGTLDALRENPDEIHEFFKRRISRRDLLGWAAILENYKHYGQVRMLLETLFAGIKVPKELVDQLIQAWGVNAYNKVQANPYRVLIDWCKLKFPKVDTIVINRLKLDPQSVDRRVYATRHAIEEHCSRTGDTLIPVEDAEAGCQKLIERLPGADAMEQLETRGLVVRRRDGAHLQLQQYFRQESRIVEGVRRLLGSSRQVRFAIDREGMADDQLQAIDTISENMVALLLGLPGTGKTWTVAKIIQGALAQGLLVKAAAPTGKAAKRMTEAMNGLVEATTVHRLLAATPNPEGGFFFRHDHLEPIEAGFLVVDEVSMLDSSLAASLFDAIGQGTKVLLVGDTEQLPSVQPGAVLRDLIAGGVPHVKLTQIKRNAGALMLATHAIAAGQMPKYSPRFDFAAGENLRGLELPETRIKEGIEKALAYFQEQGFDPVWDVQVIAPFRTATEFSVSALNKFLAPLLNPTLAEGGTRFRVGDKVICLSNSSVNGWLLSADGTPIADPSAYIKNDGKTEDSAQEDNPTRSQTEQANLPVPIKVGGEAKKLTPFQIAVVNGDMGRVEEIGEHTLLVRHWLPDRLALYKKSEEDMLDLAFCQTLHKMQGSGFPVVILPFHPSFTRVKMWSREWVYTAMSRAEKACLVIGTPDAVLPALPRRIVQERQTGLAEMLEQAQIPGLKPGIQLIDDLGLDMIAQQKKYL